MKKIWMLSFFVITTIFTLSAQSPQIEIYGKITDAETGEPLIGASILIFGTGTVSDYDGNYKIYWHQEEKIAVECQYIGYEKQQQVINGLEERKIELNFKLQAALALMEEVVVLSAEKKRYKRSKTKAKKRLSSALSDAAMPRPEIFSFSDADVAATSTSSVSSPSATISAGTLTAGEIHDFSKWELWQDLAAEDLHQWESHWNFHLNDRYTVQVRTEEGFPVVDASVFLQEGGKIIWQAKTDNTGKAELWSSVFGAQKKGVKNLTAVIEYGGKTYELSDLKGIKEGLNFLQIDEACQENKAVDIAFVVDATGSMGDEIQYLQTELKDVIERIRAKKEDLTINLGSVFYKDNTDDYLTRKADFSSNISETVKFIQAQSAGGGGDYPEAMDAALDVALNQLKWSETAKTKLLFLVLDAPPHYTPEILEKIKTLTLLAAEKGVRIIPVAGSGIDKSTEYLMRSFALATNGTYVFLTDHSGVGNSHLEPTTDEYEVEKFNDLLVRVIEQYTTIRNCNEPIADKAEEGQQPKNKELQKVDCYPNPTTGIFRVKLKKAVEELLMTDQNGKVLFRLTNLQKGETEINLANFPAGIYFVRFAEKEKLRTERIILAY